MPPVMPSGVFLRGHALATNARPVPSGLRGSMTFAVLALAFLATGTVHSSAVSAQTVVSTWKVSPVYSDCAGPTDLAGRVWFDPVFDDSQWQSAVLPERNLYGAALATNVFRGRFDVTSLPTQLWLSFSSDDGADVFVNGLHIGTYGGECPSLGCVNLPEACGVSACVPPIDITAALVLGTNNISVQRWNGGAGGAVAFDAKVLSALPSGLCGNCVVDPGEQCDAGLSPTCGSGMECVKPGSMAACSCQPLCGNGVLNSGEQCDDGNRTSGDCCSATCQIEPSGSPCQLTDDLFCNGVEKCQGVTCVRGPAPCPLACDEVGDSCITACPDQPRTCSTAAKSHLAIRSKPDDGHDKMVFNMTSSFVEQSSSYVFADPRLTKYVFCLYAGAAGQRVGQSVIDADSAKWIVSSPDHYKYTDKTGSSDGITSARFRNAGASKKVWRAFFKGKGVQLPDPQLPLSTPVTAQLFNATTGSCAQTRYEGYQAKSDSRGFSSPLKKGTFLAS